MSFKHHSFKNTTEVQYVTILGCTAQSAHLLFHWETVWQCVQLTVSCCKSKGSNENRKLAISGKEFLISHSFD